MTKKLGLVLGSGGARGVAHIGFLQALDENGIKPHCIAGCSMGSVVGGLYCKGLKPKEMIDIAISLKTSDVVDLDISMLSKKAFLKSSKMESLLDKYFGETTFEELSIPFMCNAFDINHGKTVWFSHGKVAPCVKASSSIPLVFKPVEMGDKQLIDGGAVCRLPYEAIKKMGGADVIIGVDVLGKLRRTYRDKNLLTHFLRMVDAIDWHNTLDKTSRENYDLLLMPDLGSMSQYVVKNIKFAYDKGYECAMEHIEQIKQLVE